VTKDRAERESEIDLKDVYQMNGRPAYKGLYV
jgi:hypothetical protein